ncbi:MAG: hypothetical protein JXR16_02080 [Bermanella sp.]
MKRILISLLVALSTFLSAQQSLALNPYGFEQILHIGHVYARSIVYDEDTGLPLWATYNEDGGHTKIQLDATKLAAANRGRVVSGENYRAYQKAYDDFEAQYEGKVDLLPVSDFQEQAANGSLTTKDGQPIQNWNAASIGNDVLSIAIPSKEKRLQFDANQIEKLYFPVNLAIDDGINDDTKSVLIDIEGNILEKSTDRIGKLSAFYVEKGKELENTAEYEYSSGIKKLHNYDILDPVSGVFIEGITGYINGATSSGSDGFYKLRALPTPCPGFQYSPRLTGTARLYYVNFNPKGSPAIPYFIEKTSENTCIGYGAAVNPASAEAADVIATIAFAPENITTLNYPIAINVLAGNAILWGAAISDSEPTEYFAEQSPMTDYMAPNDYDGDGAIDGTVRGDLNDQGQFIADESAGRYGVFLTSNPRDDGQPNFTRVIDTQQDLKHKGLVKTINKDDLIETDILVFRESTGQLITERSGLSDEDVKHSKVIGRLQQDGNGNFSYTIAIRSTEDTASFRSARHGGWDKWQAASKMNPELHDHQSDFIRNGEQLRIVAINRATGYIGTVITELTGPRDGGNVTVPVPPIIMGPPNLKAWATRRYQPQGNQFNADEKRHTIGNEGAATNDDELIEIHTKWLDANGFPLPAGLQDRGYTGRLVKVATDPANTNDPYSTNTSEFVSNTGTQTSEFSINPGTQLQVLKFAKGEIGQYHYYMQVNGKTGAEQNDFSSGNHTGVLRHRPNKYVPVKVPLFDETITNVNKILQQQQNPEAKDLDAAFNWVYRPELSFSVVDLEVSSILLHSNDPEDEPLELVNATDPVISTQDSAVEIFYKLLGSQYDRITPLDGEQTFILAIGEQEIEISVDGDGTPIKFTNLEHLGEIKPEDYLSIRLYLNEDSQNVLWDWAFNTLDLDIDSDNNNGFAAPDRTLQEEENETKDQHPGKTIPINDGDINKNDIPDYAEFEYLNDKGALYSKKLVPFVIEIPAHVDIAGATIKFEYAGSDPLDIKQEADTNDPDTIIYTPAEGDQRLWLKNADKKRNPMGVNNGGDYITPNTAYGLLQLGFDNSKRIKTFYIEGIRRTKAGAAVTHAYLEYQP